MTSATPPGRLGDKQMSPAKDPRTHPSMMEAMRALGVDQLAATDENTPQLDAPFEQVYAWTAATDEAMNGMYGMMKYDVPQLASSIKTTRSEEFVTTPDGFKVRLIIYRPAHAAGSPLPAVMYIHGGGMTIVNTDNYVHTSYLESIARTGLVAIAVDYRNAYTKAGHNPFPTGLNDCAAAVQWVNAHKEQLGISKIILQGESGGANLSIATALKANKEGWIKAIDGVSASVPYISGAYGESEEWKLKHLPSLVECDAYFISCHMMALLVRVYDPKGENAQNPLAWPYWAKEEDLKGLPPFQIHINELDPLRDEGSAFYKMLAKAGVRVIAKMNLGAMHAAELFFRHTVADHFLSYVDEIKTFADRV